jgi:large subunit ribosomal protein L25
MADTTLKAERRDDSGKGVARKLRADGRVPAVVYGADEDTLSLSVDAHDAELLFGRISVENTIVSLKVAGIKEPMETLVREVQVHPYRPDILHVDFYRVQKGVAVDVDIPLTLEGIPNGVRHDGGIMEQTLNELSVRCIPSRIPEAIVVDVTELQIGDSLHVSDLEIPEDVEVQTDLARTICVVSLPRVEVEEVEEEEVIPTLVGEAPEEGEAEQEGESEAETEDEG